MRVIEAEEIGRLVGMEAMIEALRAAFRGGIVQPVRHHHVMERGSVAAGTLLLMPAWTGRGAEGDKGGFAGVKIVTVSPDNARFGKPSVMGTYVLMAGDTGEPLAVIDGQALTLWRTAAASGLAAGYLARADAANHLVIGAGALSGFLARAMRAVRPIALTTLWNRTRGRAEAAAESLRALGFAAEVATDLEAAVGRADIVSAATLSREPIIRGDWLRPGTHVDLVGAFSPAMRECDARAVERARVFVDTREGALTEGGDLVQAIAEGAFSAGEVAGDLAGLTGGAAGRQTPEEITLFKSVGAALEDLAAAVLVYERSTAPGG